MKIGALMESFDMADTKRLVFWEPWGQPTDWPSREPESKASGDQGRGLTGVLIAAGFFMGTPMKKKPGKGGKKC